MNSVRFYTMMPLLFVLLVITTGCWDRQEMNDRAIILGWGMDLNEDGSYTATANIVVPTNTKSGGAQGGNNEYMLQTAKGRSVIDAAQNIQKKMSRVLFASHRRNIFLGESLAKKGVGHIVDEYARNPELRLRTNIFVVKGGTAQQAMSLSNQMEKNPSVAVLKIQEKIGAPVGRSLLDFFIMSNAYGGSVMPVLQIASPPGESKKKNENDSPPTPTLEAAGSAIFDRSLKLTGYLGFNEYWARLWIVNKLRNRDLIAQMDGRESTVAVRARNFKSKVTPVINTHLIRLNVELSAQGQIPENNTGLDLSIPENIKKVETRLNQQLQRQIEHIVTKVQDEFQTDIFDFGDIIHRKYPQQWKKMAGDWNTLFRTADISVKVRVKVDGAGLTGKSLLPDVSKGEE